MITMRGTMGRMFLAVLLAWSTSIPASAEEWEAQIVASTPNGAENSIYFGQKPDATDGYDSRYEVRAMLSGDIMAYFPHAEWDVLAKHLWRDIKAPDQLKSWVFEVNTALSGTETRLKWNPLKLPQGYAVELIDMAQNAVIDMTSQSDYYFYTDSGPRQFTINTKAPDMAVFLKSPSGLEGAWGENNTVIHLTWTDNSEGESGFMLERKVPGGEWMLITLIDANTTSYSDYNIATTYENKSRVKYIYRVKAYNELTQSDYSNEKPFK